MGSKKEKGKEAGLVRWAWESQLELELPNCVFPLVVGLAAVPWGCGFWERSRLTASRAVVFMASCGFGTRFLFQLLPRRVVWVRWFLVAWGSAPNVQGLGGCCHWWLPQDPFPVTMELRCGCSAVPFCRCRASDILFQVRLTTKMCWTLERDVLSTQSSLQA